MTSAWEKRLSLLLFAWFAGRVAWLATSLHPYVPPDEVTHFGRVLAYAAVWGVPANGPGSYELGLLDHRPWLYYWLLARGLALDLFGAHPLVFARLLNGALGVGTAAVGMLWVRSWCDSPWARLLFLALLTNTLMFTGISASVSYDNGANLLAATALLALTRARQTGSLAWLLALVGTLAAGVLAKRTLLPFAAIVTALWLVREGRRLPAILAGLVPGVRDGGPPLVALAAGAGVLVVLSLALYGGNQLRYGQLRPGFDQVVGEEAAMQNRVYARGRILDDFREGRIGIQEARARAASIRHAGDRGDTLFLLKAVQRPESAVIGPLAYLPAWGYRMLKTSVGYLGHRRAVKQDRALVGYGLVFGVAAALLAWRWRPGDANGVPADAAVLVLAYAMVLMWLVNYPNYQTYRYIELALQGRYLFPVLVPLYGLVAWAIGERAPAAWQPWLCTGTGLLFLYGDLPWLVQQMDDRWFMPG